MTRGVLVWVSDSPVITPRVQSMKKIGTFGLNPKPAVQEVGHLHLSGNKGGSYLFLSSSLSVCSGRPALGYSHHLSDVDFGSGLLSHRQHPLHRHHGKRHHGGLQPWNTDHIHQSKNIINLKKQSSACVLFAVSYQQNVLCNRNPSRFPSFHLSSSFKCQNKLRFSTILCSIHFLY